jgi:hypothetical protein
MMNIMKLPVQCIPSKRKVNEYICMRGNQKVSLQVIFLCFVMDNELINYIST